MIRLLHHYTSTGNRAFSSVSLVELRRGSMICLLRIESQACYIKPQLLLTDLSHFMTAAGSSWGPCELRREPFYVAAGSSDLEVFGDLDA